MAAQLIIIVKHVIVVLLLLIVLFLPAYLARKTGLDKTNMTRIRIASWVLSWTGIAWLWALFRATQK